MRTASAQPDLFECDAAADDSLAGSARARMRDMIDRLQAASAPPWKDEMAVILDDGAFQRAMQLVPPAEAQSLWAEFDAQMERLYAIWQQARPAPES